MIKDEQYRIVEPEDYAVAMLEDQLKHWQHEKENACKAMVRLNEDRRRQDEYLDKCDKAVRQIKAALKSLEDNEQH